MTILKANAAGESPASSWVAAEIRAQIARQGLTHSGVAKVLGVPGAWISRRIGAGANVPLTLEDIDRIAAVLGMDGRDLIYNGLADRTVLPRLDSNQQPSGYPLVLVRRMADVVSLASYRGRAA